MDIVQNEKLVSYGVKSAAKASGLSESSIRQAIRDGQLGAKKFGTVVMIPAQNLEDFIEGLPDWTPGGAPTAANEARRSR